MITAVLSFRLSFYATPQTPPFFPTPFHRAHNPRFIVLSDYNKSSVTHCQTAVWSVLGKNQTSRESHGSELLRGVVFLKCESLFLFFTIRRTPCCPGESRRSGSGISWTLPRQRPLLSYYHRDDDDYDPSGHHLFLNPFQGRIFCKALLSYSKTRSMPLRVLSKYDRRL